MLEHPTRELTPKPFCLRELAELTQAKIIGSSDLMICGVGTLANAKNGELTFLASAKYSSLLSQTLGSVVVLSEEQAPNCPVTALVHPDPKWVFAQAVNLLYRKAKVFPGIHATALIDQDCHISNSAHIGAGCILGKRVTLEDGVIVSPGCVIGDDCKIGKNTTLYPKVVIYQGVIIGQDCVIHSGVVLGSDGFGFTRQRERWIKVPQIGRVKIHDRVEIGANTTIDRGAIEDTVIESDVILDNLIQIAHNVHIKQGTAIAACVGIAGSTTIGKNCMIGGGSRINGHIQIADHVMIVGCSNVAQSIAKSGAYGSGIDSNDIKIWKKNLVRFHQLNDLALRVAKLEKCQEQQQETH